MGFFITNKKTIMSNEAELDRPELSDNDNNNNQTVPLVVNDEDAVAAPISPRPVSSSVPVQPVMPKQTWARRYRFRIIVFCIVFLLLVALGLLLWFFIPRDTTSPARQIALLAESLKTPAQYYAGTADPQEINMGIHFKAKVPITIAEVGVWMYNPETLAEQFIYFAPVQAISGTTEDGKKITLYEPDEEAKSFVKVSTKTPNGAINRNITWFTVPVPIKLITQSELDGPNNEGYMIYVKRANNFQYRILSKPGSFFDASSTWNSAELEMLPMYSDDAPFLSAMGANFVFYDQV